MNVLEQKEKKIDISIKEFDPQEFFKNGDGLYVYSDFKERILSKAEKVPSLEKALTSYDLTKNANDAAIEADLPKDHLFSESEVCAIVADLIGKQPKGEEGILLNSGYANLFYTPSFVVHVDGDGAGWNVDAWSRRDSGRDAGSRVFSPATDL